MRNIEHQINEFLVERGWDELRPSDLAKSISIESAELLELFQWESVELEEVKQDPQRIEEVKKELADVLIYVIQMAVLLDIDPEEIITTKLERVKKKYPAELMRKNAKRGGRIGRRSGVLGYQAFRS